MLAHLGKPMVDVRSPQEYTGEKLHMPDYPQEGAVRGGHIPGAASVPWAQAVKEDGTFKSADELRELERRERAYRDDRPPPDVSGRIVILIDDGLATGSTMRAAVAALRQLGPVRIVVATPVGAAESCAALADETDETVCLRMPDPFYAVGAWYDDFSQTSDDEVRELLARADDAHAPV